MSRTMPDPGVDRSPVSHIPRVVVSSVVRSSHQGESHGGVYLVDFRTGDIQQVIDWDDPTISWEGRGADRGLRGIATHQDRVYLAASDEIFVYDTAFQLQGSFRNRYLKHTHEICIADDRLYATSTGFDSILELDLQTQTFTRGRCLRFGLAERGRRKFGGSPTPSLIEFDPEGGGGPAPGDTTHLNNVYAQDGTLFASGRALAHLLAIGDTTVARYAPLPYGSHNARPYRDGVLFNHTGSDNISYTDREGQNHRSFHIVTYDPAGLLHASLGPDTARQAFGRGLAVMDHDLIVGGSSPATVTLYRFDSPEPLESVNLTMDVRNAVHGLEAWPFD